MYVECTDIGQEKRARFGVEGDYLTALHCHACIPCRLVYRRYIAVNETLLRKRWSWSITQRKYAQVGIRLR